MIKACAPPPAPDVQQVFLHALQVARRAPSGNNVQPWRLLVLRPMEVDLLIAEAVRTASSTGVESGSAEVEQLRAPFSVLCLIDQRLGRGSSLDYGMFLQNVCLSAAARGVHVKVLHAGSCFSDAVSRMASLPEHHRVLCALAVGPADEGASVSDSRAVETQWLE